MEVRLTITTDLRHSPVSCAAAAWREIWAARLLSQWHHGQGEMEQLDGKAGAQLEGAFPWVGNEP